MILSKDEGEELMARCKPFDGVLCKALARLGFIIAEDDESAIRDGDPKIEICRPVQLVQDRTYSLSINIPGHGDLSAKTYRESILQAACMGDVVAAEEKVRLGRHWPGEEA
jgi:hypothetical protein